MHFSFSYDGRRISSAELKGEEKRGRTVYRVDGICITQERRVLRGGEYSLLWFENRSGERSGIISDVCDVDEVLPFERVASFSQSGMDGYYQDVTKIVRAIGCNGVVNEYMPRKENLRDGGNEYRCEGGRSSQGILPYLEAQCGKDEGVLLGIGWSGQWACRFDKAGDTALRVRAGIEGLHFYLEPGEKIRTAAVLLVPYRKGSIGAHNAFRRIIRDEFSLIGKKGRGCTVPLSMQCWGGARTDFLKGQIEKEKALGLGLEYFWLDAGWYGDYTEESPDEFRGNWGAYTGDWTVNKMVHPGGLGELFDAARSAGLQGLLWMEPERVRKTTKFYAAHPEMFIDIGRNDVMLDLSRKSNQDYMIETVSAVVGECRLKCFRQDCNFDLLDYWNSADGEDRRGITQIQYIMGLYRVWDELLARFPELIIDNCSSGGKRLDFEACSRSVPLWRSDMNCTFDFDPDLAQNQNMGLMLWLPYHGNGAGRYPYDKYRFRSCHAAGIATNFIGYEGFAQDNGDMGAVKASVAEYKEVRKFYDKDYYPVFGFPEGDAAWAGWQLHDPAKGQGVVMAFRRRNCLSGSAAVSLGGLREGASYEFEDKDTGEKFTYSPKDGPFTVYAAEKGVSKMFVYREL